MFDKEQSQSAGENSNQFQARNMIVVNGVDEKRVREICQEFKEYTLREVAQTASETANARIEKLETKLVPRIANVENGVSSLCDPEFFSLLKRIQLSAAESSRESDYEMLSELLCHRIKHKSDMMNKAAINKAVSIVNQIDDNALNAMTVFYFAEKFYPTSGIITDGLNVLDDYFSKIVSGSLPLGIEWIEHLDLLGALRQSSMEHLKKLPDYYAEKMEGYWGCGIKVESEEYVQSQQILQEKKLPQDILVPHELDSECVRIPVVNRASIDNYHFSSCVQNIVVNIPFTDAQKECVRKIYDISLRDNDAMQKRRAKFCETLQTFPSLKKVIDWWNQISVGIKLTDAGRVLAHANAQRCSPNIPSLE